MDEATMGSRVRALRNMLQAQQGDARKICADLDKLATEAAALADRLSASEQEFRAKRDYATASHIYKRVMSCRAVRDLAARTVEQFTQGVKLYRDGYPL